MSKGGEEKTHIWVRNGILSLNGVSLLYQRNRERQSGREREGGMKRVDKERESVSIHFEKEEIIHEHFVHNDSVDVNIWMCYM